MAFRYLIYRTDFGNTIVRESPTDTSTGGTESALYTDFNIPVIQPLFYWRVSGPNVIVNIEANINDWLAYTAVPHTPYDLVTFADLTGQTSTLDLQQVTANGAVTTIESEFNGGLITNKIRPSANTITAIQVNKADGLTNIINVDTVSGFTGFGTIAPRGIIHLFGRDNTPGDEWNVQTNNIRLDGNPDVDKDIVWMDSGTTKWAAQTFRDEGGKFWYLYNVGDQNNVISVSETGRVGINNPTNTMGYHAALISGSPNDITIGGIYTQNYTSVYEVLIDSITGATDTFIWRVSIDNGITYGSWSTPSGCTLSAMTLQYGVTVKFDSVTGHELNTEWIFGAFAQLPVGTFVVATVGFTEVLTTADDSAPTISYTDVTAEANSSTLGGDVPIFVTGTTNSGIYFGTKVKIDSIYINMKTPGTSIQLYAQFWNGSTWVTIDNLLDSFIDGTNNLSKSGALTWDSTLMTGWIPEYIPDKVEDGYFLYWIRLVTATSPGVAPEANSFARGGDFRFAVLTSPNDVKPAYYVDSLGRVNIGGGNITGGNRFQVNTGNNVSVTATGTDSLVEFDSENSAVVDLKIKLASNDAYPPGLTFVKTRGTLDVSSCTQQGDILGAIKFRGRAGTFGRLLSEIGSQFVGSGTTRCGDIYFNTANGSDPVERVRIAHDGNTGFGIVDPTATVHIKAGTTINAPLKFNSGSLLSSAQAGAVEYNGNSWHGTISGNSRYTFAFLEAPIFTGNVSLPSTTCLNNTNLCNFILNSGGSNNNNLFLKKCSFNVYSGTTVPNTYYNKTQINAYTGATGLAQVTAINACTNTLSCFNSGISTPKIKPLTNSVSGFQFTQANGTTPIVTIDSISGFTGFGSDAPKSLVHLYGRDITEGDGWNYQANSVRLDGVANADKDIQWFSEGEPKFTAQIYRGENGKFWYLSSPQAQLNQLTISQTGRIGINNQTNIMNYHAVRSSGTTGEIGVGGVYTQNFTSVFNVEINGTGATDTFRWRISSDNGISFGAWSATSGVTTSPVELIHGVTVAFTALSGYTIGENWYFGAFAQLPIATFAITPNFINEVEKTLDYTVLPASAITFTDITGEANTSSFGAEIQIFDTGTTANAIYFGTITPVNAIQVNLGTVGAGVSLVTEYWTGSAWVAMTSGDNNYVDGTLNLTTIGSLTWETTSLSGFAKAYIPGMVEAGYELYWIRIRTASPPTIAPTAVSFARGGDKRFAVMSSAFDYKPSFFVDSEGRLSIGGGNITGKNILQINKNKNVPITIGDADSLVELDSEDASQIDLKLKLATNQDCGSGFVIGRTRGTLSNGLDVQSGDSIGHILFKTRANNVGVTINEICSTYYGDGNTCYGDLMFNTANGGAPIEKVRVSGKGTGFGAITPTAQIHIQSGSTFANTAPLKFTTGGLLGTPENGAVEYNGTAWYGTIASGRKTFAFLEAPQFTGNVNLPSTTCLNAVNLCNFILNSGGTNNTSLVKTITLNSYTATTQPILNGAVTGATNGLTKSGRNVILGGNLCQNTTITGITYDLTLSSKQLNLFGVNGIYVCDKGAQGVHLYTDGCHIDIEGRTSGGVEKTKLLLSETLATFTDSRTTPVGMEYFADYSANYTCRSIPDVGYVNSVAAGLNVIASVVVATTTNITLSGLTTVDGHLLTNGERVLVKNQTSGSTNGIYVATGVTWQRASDYDFTPGGEINNGDLIPVVSGNTNANTIWVLTTPDPITSGNTLSYSLFSTTSSVIGGNGICVTQSSGNYNVAVKLPVNSSLCVDGTGLYLNSSIAGTGLCYGSGVLCVDGSGLAGNSICWSANTFNVSTTTGTLNTALNSKLNVSEFNIYSGNTLSNINSRLLKSTFSGYTGTTVPSTYLSIANFNTYSGTTVPNTYYNKTQINNYTGATQSAINLKANINSPTFTGIPLAPSAATNTCSSQIATTAFVLRQAGTASPLMNGSVLVGTSFLYSRQDHVHPSDTSRVALTTYQTYTGTTAPNTFANKTVFNSFTAATQSMYTKTLEPTGFVNNDNIIVTYSKTGRTITLSAITGTVQYYWRGVLHDLGSSWTSLAHGDTTQAWYLYSNDGTNITWSNTGWQFSDLQVASRPANVAFGLSETHGTMQYDTHEELHDVVGTYVDTGFGLTPGTYQLQPAVPTDADNTPGFDAGIIADEDLHTSINAWTQGSYSLVYFTGSTTPAFVFVTGSSRIFRLGSTYPQINPWNGSSFSNVEMSANTFANWYVFRLPVTKDGESQTYRTFIVQPQYQYNTVLAAQGENLAWFNITPIKNGFAEYVPVERITMGTSATYSGATGKVRIDAEGILVVSKFGQVGSVSGAVSADASNVSVTPISPFTSNNMQDLSNEYANAINARLTIANFNTFSGTTLPNNYYNKTQINAYTGATQSKLNAKAFLSGATFTGIVNVCKPTQNDNTNCVATTSWYISQGGTATPLMNGVGGCGISNLFARQDHVHPTDTSRLAVSAFNTYSGTTVPNTYYNKTQINTYTGTTVPNTYALKANAITGATNLGSGNAIYTSVSANKIQLKSISGGTGIAISNTGTQINVCSTITQFNWAGTTANGVGTYVSATCVCSNPNMTFNGSSLSVTGNILASTYICSPIITGSTRVCSPIICGTSCVASPIMCASSCMRSPLISGGTICGLTSAFAPTPATNNNSTCIATTAWYFGQCSTATPLMNSTGAVGTSGLWSKQDHVHPSDTSRLAVSAFNTYSGTTVPNTYYNKTQINTFTGTTLPANYYNKTQINAYSASTLININSRVLKAGDTMTGALVINNNLTVTGTSIHRGTTCLGTLGSASIVTDRTLFWNPTSCAITARQLTGGSDNYHYSDSATPTSTATASPVKYLGYTATTFAAGRYQIDFISSIGNSNSNGCSFGQFNLDGTVVGRCFMQQLQVTTANGNNTITSISRDVTLSAGTHCLDVYYWAGSNTACIWYGMVRAKRIC